MNDVTIRNAALRDACAIATIQVRASLIAYKGIFSSPSPTLTIERRRLVWRDIIATAHGQQRVLVAEQSDEICGYAHFGPTRDAGEDPMSTGELYSLYVAPERWRQGIGGRLLVDSMHTLGRGGFDACTLWVLALNDLARRFYQRHGWRFDGAKKPADQGVLEVRYRTEGRVP
jgi:ribosomal protein S18 acetylase RimI-like enzyme